MQGVANARNLVQVRNTIHRERVGQLIHRDQLLAVCIINEEIDCIRSMQIIPDLTIVHGIKECSSFMLSCLCSSPTRVIFTVDTTYNLTDFYVTPLLMLIEAENGCHQFPVMHLIHDRRAKSVQLELMRQLSSAITSEELHKKMIFLTDREPGIVLSIRESFRSSLQFFCWNHLKKDLERWLTTHRYSSSDTEEYVDDLYRLLRSASVDEFDLTFVEIKSKWDADALGYFRTNMLSDIRNHAATFLLFDAELPYPDAGCYTNAAESYNATLKRTAGWKKLLLEDLVLLLTRLQCFSLSEMRRGQCGTGEWKFSRNSWLLEVSVPTPPWFPLDLSSLKPEFFSEKTSEPHDTVHRINSELANDILDKQGITHVPSRKAFIVEGTSKHLVELHPIEKCDCKNSPRCCHVLAAKFSIGDTKPTKSKKALKITKMRRSSKQRSGQKRLRKCDADVNIQSETTSILCQRNSKTTKTRKHQEKFAPARVTISVQLNEAEIASANDQLECTAADKIESACQLGSVWRPSGLPNFGETCWFNSGIQCVTSALENLVEPQIELRDGPEMQLVKTLLQNEAINKSDILERYCQTALENYNDTVDLDSASAQKCVVELIEDLVQIPDLQQYFAYLVRAFL